MQKEYRNWIEKAIPEMVALQKLLTAVPAIAPENGGTGEKEKADALMQWLKEQTPFSISSLPVKDDRVPGGVRPNVLAVLPGTERKRAFWILTHLDVVPPGELSQWKNDPYKALEQDGRIYGRGTEDNQQGMVSSLFAALSLSRNGLTPPRDVKLLFVADEEVGSTYGIKAVLSDYPELFGPSDVFLVPDGGSPDGSKLEIAEKSLLWVQFTVTGKQVHASMPHLGINAFLAGSDLVVRMAQKLKVRYPAEDPLFDPPVSTFCPTRKEANVPNVNTIPGLDVFCFDCRVLPEYSLDQILSTMDEVAREVEREYGVTVSRKILQRNDSAATQPNSPLVQYLKQCLKRMYGIDAREIGIGGNTVGVFLRRKGWDTVVWSTLEETAHMPNEYCLIENMVKDSIVMAELMLASEV